jgi:hypothetical protein
MRRFFTRWLWVVVAIAVQSAAASGLDRYGRTLTHRQDDAICQAGRGAFADQRAPFGHAPHSLDCVSCQSCLGGQSSLSADAAAGRFAAPAHPALVAWRLRFDRETRLRLASSHRARAPPLSF